MACSPVAASSGDPLVEDDIATDDGFGDDGSDSVGCSSVGCACNSNSDCTSKLCTAKGGKQVCVSCIVSNGGVEKCDGLDNNCNSQVDEGTCPGDGKCLLGACDGASGKCHMEFAIDQSSCDDANACTQADKCAQGVCAGWLTTCDDGNPCTSEDCEPDVGCELLPIAAICDDGNACTIADACVNAKCVGQAKDCADSNPCTTDSCGDGVCLSKANTATCDDGNGCTSGDVCANLTCTGTLNCQDGDPCTLDACDAAANACKHTPKVGWQTPLCTSCAPGFSGSDCGTCTTGGKIWPDC